MQVPYKHVPMTYNIGIGKGSKYIQRDCYLYNLSFKNKKIMRIRISESRKQFLNYLHYLQKYIYIYERVKRLKDHFVQSRIV